MTPPEAEHPEWIDGFLFVGNHLALNFLNTKPVLEDGPREFLPDPEAFGRWLVAAGLVTSPRKISNAILGAQNIKGRPLYQRVT